MDRSLISIDKWVLVCLQWIPLSLPNLYYKYIYLYISLPILYMLLIYNPSFPCSHSPPYKTLSVLSPSQSPSIISPYLTLSISSS